MYDNYELNDKNFLLYAAKHFDKPYHILSEFEDDLKKIKYVKRLIRRYINTGKLKERLILNHIIVLANVFGVEQTVKMLFFKLDKQEYTVLKTFLLYLGYLPDVVVGVNGVNINTKDIPVDLGLANILRQI